MKRRVMCRRSGGTQRTPAVDSRSGASARHSLSRTPRGGHTAK